MAASTHTAFSGIHNAPQASGKYKEVEIGKQVWMSENLDVDRFRNGDPIPEAQTFEAWKSASDNKEPVWCYYNYNPENGDKYGKLYNWYAVVDPRSLAPEGWKIPSAYDWAQLIDHLGGKQVAGNKMKSPDGWHNDGNGNNESGFSGLPGGMLNGFNGTFNSIGEYGAWWSTTEFNILFAWLSSLFYNDDIVEIYDTDKRYGFSVRCIRE